METLQVGHIYDIRLSKILSLSPTELRVKLLSPQNPAQQLSPLVRLDSFLPHLGCGSGNQVWDILLRETESDGTQCKMLVKYADEDTAVLVEVFMMTSSSCILLSDLLVSLQLGRLADRVGDSLPTWSGLEGHRLPVTICQQSPPHPANILLTLDEVTEHLLADLAQCDLGGGLTRLVEGGLMAVKVAGRWERARLLQLGLMATVELVDTDRKVTVEYANCRDLPASLHSLPPALVKICLTDLHCDGWTDVSSARLAHMLHLHTTPPITPKLFIIVHSLEGSVWEVSLLEEVSRNHQVNIGALVVAEGLARCMLTDQMRVVLGWGEARGEDTGPWLRERNSGTKKLDEQSNDVPSKAKSCISTDSSLKSLDSGLTEASSSLDLSGRGQIVDMGGQYSSGFFGGGEKSGKHQLSTSPVSLDSGVERENSNNSVARHLDCQDGMMDSLPNSFTGIITNIEGEAGVVWVVPSFMKGQQKLVNALLASLSRRLPVPSTGVGEGEERVEFSTGDNVLAWWAEDRCWFRARVLETHTDISTTVLFMDWGNTEQLPPGQVMLPRPGLSGYQALARLPGLAVQARLYGLQMEELEEEGKKKLFTHMSRVQSATGNWDSLAQVTVCHRRPLLVTVQYQDNMLDLNLSAVLIAGRFATVNLSPLPSCEAPPPCPLPWQFNHSWPGQVVGVQDDQVWVVPVPLTDQYGLSDRDWYLDRSIQLLARLHSQLVSKLRDAFLSGSAGQFGTLAVGQTVIWWERRGQEQYHRGEVRDMGAGTNIVSIFLSDCGRLKEVEYSCLQVCPAELCCFPARAMRLRLGSSGTMALVRKERVVLVTVLRGDMAAYIRSVCGGTC